MLQAAQNRLVTPADISRVLLGWGSFVALVLAGPLLQPPVPPTGLVSALTAIVAVVIVCAFGVVKQAEALARRLGDPYGSLVLTLSIVLIEVILVGAVMLGPGEHTTIARDSVMAVSMIIMNLVIGVSLLVGGLRHGWMRHNRSGASTYLAMLIVLAALAFALPSLIGEAGSYTLGQEVPIVALTLVVYAFFLVRQMGAQADDFREVDERFAQSSHVQRGDVGPVRIGQVLREHRREVIIRLVLLVITVLPIVLLSQYMAALLDDGMGRLGAPLALAGMLIAMIVFLPESLTSVRAALGGEAQRVSNLCHGALVSTVGLTIPAVLVIGRLTGQKVVLAESSTNLLMLGATMLLSAATFTSPRLTAVHGAAHLVLFAVYFIALLS